MIFVKKLVNSMLAVLMICSLSISGATAAGRTVFPDVDEIKYGWAVQSIRLMNGQQVLTGYSDGLFRPEKPVSKAEWAAMAYRLFDKYRPVQSQSAAPFADVSSRHWAYTPISSLFHGESADFSYGKNASGDSLFKPDQPMSRLQLALLLFSMFDHRLIDQKLEEKDICAVVSTLKDVPVRYFASAEEANAYAMTDGRYVSGGFLNANANTVFPILAVGQGASECRLGTDSLTNGQAKALISLQASGIMTPYAGYFRPMEPVTRAEAVTILHRIYAYLNNNRWLDSYTAVELGTEILPGLPSAAGNSGSSGSSSGGSSGSPGGASGSAGGAVTQAGPGTFRNNPQTAQVSDYFNEHGMITKDLQANGEIKAGVQVLGEGYLTIQVSAQDKEKVDLWITIDGQPGFARYEEFPMTIPLEGVSYIELRSQWRARKTNLADGMIAALTVQLSDTAPVSNKR